MSAKATAKIAFFKCDVGIVQKGLGYS